VAQEVTVKYTWMGDSNLDGIVNAAGDFPMYLAGLNDTTGTKRGWEWGDYNYDGVTNAAGDFVFYLRGLNGQTGTLGAAEADQGLDGPALMETGAVGGFAGGSAVPEPGVMLLTCAGLAGLAVRWRRRARVPE
jgi:hypothetical protein